MKIMFIGEIVGQAGVDVIKNALAKYKEENNINFVIANAEGATHGFGLGRRHAGYLRKLGVDILTGGEKLFYKPDLVENLGQTTYVLRPANFPPSAPGRSYKIVTIEDKKVAIVNIIGNSGVLRAAQSPYTAADYLVTKLEKEADIILLQFHVATTADAASMFHYLDGKVQAVIGTHSKVMTADAQVSKKGTAFISDNGRTGSFMSVGGLDPAVEIEKFVTAVPLRSSQTEACPMLQGVIVEIIDGKVDSIKTVREEVVL